MQWLSFCNVLEEKSYPFLAVILLGKQAMLFPFYSWQVAAGMLNIKQKYRENSEKESLYAQTEE